MYTFHTTIHVRPESCRSGPVIELDGRPIRPLDAPSNQLGEPFRVTFEAAAEALSCLDRLFCEPDGSFFWVGGLPAAAWQVDGQLFDRDHRLLYVELKGSCPADGFDQLLSAFGWPETQLVFQLAREAVLLDESEFRKQATRADEAGSV